MRIRIRRRLPVSVYFVTIILGVAGGVYIWHPVVKQLKLQQQLEAPKAEAVSEKSTEVGAPVSPAAASSIPKKE
ncbi:hypothetical protein ElyMa_006170900 [Elysia marginata]|uniref:Uncharacterized protein n=1 Tax=Elysia marginata TaxID=1093978 RepID=A0AAV4GZP4_9GAST|nr:hypothetical protein ElyMa_006170900 [Elysia marginata]